MGAAPGASKTTPRVKGIGASGAGVALGLAAGRAGVPKFVLEKLELLGREDLLKFSLIRF